MGMYERQEILANLIQVAVVYTIINIIKNTYIKHFDKNQTEWWLSHYRFSIPLCLFLSFPFRPVVQYQVS